METVDVLMKMPKIDGYEYTGEWRIPKPGEAFVCSVSLLGSNLSYPGTVARPILRKVQVWKRLTLEKALEMGKTRKKFTFRINSHSQPFSDTVDYLDLNPDTRSNVRMSHYGWGCASDIEYLEE